MGLRLILFGCLWVVVVYLLGLMMLFVSNCFKIPNDWYVFNICWRSYRLGGVVMVVVLMIWWMILLV